MTKLTSGLAALLLMLTMTVGAFASDCPKGGDCPKAGANCPKKQAAKK